MYLKSIEIQGFKSFANRIVFSFHNGVTGIVGPNGSGKSNVSDAVRWVLGEQSAKQLRGGSMQDVIFAGTERRKPQGFAYVAITLDNSDHMLAIDYDEVTVSRRLYRSGESEYKINGSTCRLKDIHELFFDTGIGKEGYSIIGQGQIDRILSGKPEERRELFDEAAGIVKFKNRKAEAKKKLDREQQNLVRINDILAELQHRVGPLAHQAEKAGTYLKLRDALKKDEVNLFLAETGTLRQQLSELRERSAVVQGDLDDARAESAKKKEEHRQLSDEIDALELEIAGADERYDTLTQALQDKRTRSALLEEKSHHDQENARKLAERMEAIRSALAAKQEQREALDMQQKTCREEKEAEEALLQKTAERLQQLDSSLHEAEERSGDIQNELIRLLNQKADLSGAYQRTGATLEEIDSRRAQLAAELLQQQTDTDAGAQALEEKQKEFAALSRQREELDRQEKNCLDRLTSSEKQKADSQEKLAAAQQSYHVLDTRLESLRNLAERYEGYGGAIRRVMEQKKRIPGIHGVVADLISTDKRYETAIETALGGAIQNIVTDTDLTAKRLIGYLKENRAGRATFLPVSSIHPRGDFSHREALQEPGAQGLAHELIRTDPAYQNVLRSLLGKTLVVDTIDHAMQINRKYGYQMRIVTLEGELLNPGGSMTGGAFRNSSNLLGRKREIEDLEEKLEEALDRAQQEQSRLIELEESRINLEGELAELRGHGQELALQLNTLQVEIRQEEEHRNALSTAGAGLTEQIEQIRLRMESLKAEQLEREAEEAELEQRHEHLAEELDQLTDQLQARRAERNQAEAEHGKQQTEQARLEQRAGFIAEGLERLQAEEADLRSEMEDILGQDKAREDTLHHRSREMEELREEAAGLEKQIREQQEKAGKLREEKSARTGRQKQFFDEKEAIDEKIALLDRDLLRMQNQRERLEEKLERQTDYMDSEYGISLEEAEKLYDPELPPPPALKKEAAALRSQIRELGSVNVNAIEEYREVSERCSFMEKQQADLTAAEAALLKIIDELDDGMRRQFSGQFKAISEEFDTVFQELFGGGSAALELEENTDVLEAGIAIISQPPGKKLQNMMQLSGGEKALTAIALLFAIQNLKPSPFCLLDEIEAALDDSNVDRFAGYLRKLTNHTQFIVITHRRGTMLGCDRLYGITMQEKGISTMVSVSLIESELEREEKHG